MEYMVKDKEKVSLVFREWESSFSQQVFEYFTVCQIL